MIIDMIGPLEEIIAELDVKKAKKLKLQELINLVKALSERQVIDQATSESDVEREITKVNQYLIESYENRFEDRSEVRAYAKAYRHLLEEVKKDFDLQPEGSIKSTYMGIGIALGTGVGSALMSSINPAFISLGISMGIIYGVTVGNKKEKEAKLAGKLF